MKTQWSKNHWDAAKAILRGKFTAIRAYLKRQKISNKQYLLHLKELEKEEQTLHLKELEKEEQAKPKSAERK